jgi:hypothetical protein
MALSFASRRPLVTARRPWQDGFSTIIAGKRDDREFQYGKRTAYRVQTKGTWPCRLALIGAIS